MLKDYKLGQKTPVKMKDPYKFTLFMECARCKYRSVIFSVPFVGRFRSPAAGGWAEHADNFMLIKCYVKQTGPCMLSQWMFKHFFFCM